MRDPTGQGAVLCTHGDVAIAPWTYYEPVGAVDDEQAHRRDVVNHSLVVPDRGDPRRRDG